MGAPTNPLAPYATIESHFALHTRPDRPLLEAVLLDDDDPVTELMVTVDAESDIAIKMYAHNLEAGGTTHGRTHHLDEHSTLVAATVPIVGYDLATDVLVTGTVDLAITWTTNTRIADLVVDGTALLEPDWQPMPTRFAAIRRHPYNHHGLTRHNARPAATP